MIRKPSELKAKKLFKGLIAGLPGIGKSTLGVSAPAALLIDADDGWDRIPAQFRVPVIQPQSYEEILQDLKPDNSELKDFETLVFDTGGSLLTYMKSWAIKKDMKNGQKDGVTLSMRGYGTIGREFMRLMDHCIYALQKNIIVIFHVIEKSDNDETVYRIDAEGQTKNNIWKIMDFGGLMLSSNNKRIIGFSPTDKYYAKGTHGLTGTHEIPNPMKTGQNTFLADLFIQLNDNIESESQYAEDYKIVMNEIRSKIAGIKDIKTAEKAYEEIKDLEHVFSSKQEASTLMKEKLASIGMTFRNGKFTKVKK
jgi:hypothetical protein